MRERRELDLTKLTAMQVKQEINDWLLHYTEGRVQSGPFQGMEVLAERSWDDGNLGACLLGCYEQQLHPAIEKEIARLSALLSPKIANLGCAEGFYAVGFARRLPNAEVWVHDIDIRAIELSTRAALCNDVSLRTGSLWECLRDVDLVVSDCEGGEDDYLDPARFPSLATANMIVEVHTDGCWVDRFMQSHDVWIAEDGPRDPNKFEFLRRWHDLARWIAVSENRPYAMRWVILEAKPMGAEHETGIAGRDVGDSRDAAAPARPAGGA